MKKMILKAMLIITLSLVSIEDVSAFTATPAFTVEAQASCAKTSRKKKKPVKKKVKNKQRSKK